MHSPSFGEALEGEPVLGFVINGNSIRTGLAGCAAVIKGYKCAERQCTSVTRVVIKRSNSTSTMRQKTRTS